MFMKRQYILSWSVSVMKKLKGVECSRVKLELEDASRVLRRAGATKSSISDFFDLSVSSYSVFAVKATSDETHLKLRGKKKLWLILLR